MELEDIACLPVPVWDMFLLVITARSVTSPVILVMGLEQINVQSAKQATTFPLASVDISALMVLTRILRLEPVQHVIPLAVIVSIALPTAVLFALQDCSSTTSHARMHVRVDQLPINTTFVAKTMLDYPCLS